MTFPIRSESGAQAGSWTEVLFVVEVAAAVTVGDDEDELLAVHSAMWSGVTTFLIFDRSPSTFVGARARARARGGGGGGGGGGDG